MDTSDYDNKIGELTNEIDTYRVTMSPTFEKFLEEAETLVKGYYKDKIREIAIQYPEVTQKLGKDGITQLKSECREILTQIHDIVMINLGNDNYWSHKWTIEKLKNISFYHNSHYVNRSKIESDLRESLNDTLNDLKKIFIKYGYANQQEKYTNYHINYLECNEEMKKCFKKYKVLDKEFAILTSKLKSIENEKEKAKAEDLWNSTE